MHDAAEARSGATRCAAARAWGPLLFAAIALASPFPASARTGEDRILDTFADSSAWTAAGSDQVSATLRRETSADGDALCLDFDFHGVSGYASMRRPLAIDYPANYAFEFRVRGDGPDNALQFKMVDASGDNVWWVNRPDFHFSPEWAPQRFRKRQVDFAWGPTKDRTLHHSDALEFTIYAGKGGRGSACFDRLRLRELAPTPTAWPVPRATATSALRDAPATASVDGDAATAWRSDPKRGREQQLTLDLGSVREFGGLVLHWSDGAFASRYDVEVSDDARSWHRVRRVTAGNGGTDPLYLPESEARYVRLALHEGPQEGYSLAAVDIRDLSYGASANAFFSELAATAPRGRYPRGFYNEQTYWTVVGIDGGHETGLFSEDGALEVARGGFSVEPFLVDARGSVVTWADGHSEQTLANGYLPMPKVRRRSDGIDLDIEVFAAGTPDAGSLYTAYTVTNTATTARTLSLALALRPFQVNPSVQFLSTPGGVSPIHDLAIDDTAPGVHAIVVDGKPRVFAHPASASTPVSLPGAAAGRLPPAAPRISPSDEGRTVAARRTSSPTDAPPGRFFATPFDAGMVTDRLTERPLPDARSVHDDTGLASGALVYDLSIEPHQSVRVWLQIPLNGSFEPDASAPDADGGFDRQYAAVAADWRAKLDTVSLRLPPSAQALADTLRTALAHILINRDGAAIRPGTRSYARSWIRDGAMTSDALLRLGHADVAADYLRWYAPYQFRSGKVPCCVDQRGSDPVPENDSHGELIHLASEIHRYTGDRALLEFAWPHIEAAARYMDGLRASERVPANRVGERAAFYGLMPASISHEGYSAKPMHAYWDDFWALTGYKNAVAIADALGKPDDAKRLAESRDEFRTDLHASIRTAVAAHAIDYLPGSAELGDFDATSTTIALSPAGEQADLPRDLLLGTFERYWKQFVERRDGDRWKDYTPYEWRNVGAFVRLGWRDRAAQASDFFMHDRRPAGWNQWAEVVGRDARESRFIGDMPHGWVASDFIRATLDRFAFEREADAALVLAAGVNPDWLDGDGIALNGLRTPYGALTYTLHRDARSLTLRVDATGIATPPGGFVLARFAGEASRGRLNGKAIKAGDDGYVIRRLPAELVIPRDN